MTKASKKIKKVDEETELIKKQEKPKIDDANDAIEPFENAKDSLMPDLEELVKKNPNRLIGCGG